MSDLEQKYNRKELITGIVIKMVAVIASAYGMIRTMDSLKSFTYFTNLSNILIDIVLVIFICMDICLLIWDGKKDCKKNWMYIVKFMATISITLTFVIYLTLLAPTNEEGFLQAYLSNGAGSLCVHFIAPVLAIADFILYDYRYRSTKVHALFATVPPLMYVAFVVIAANLGMRWGENMYEPYNFMNFGAKTGWFGFDLSILGSETLGIGVFYMIVVLFFIFWGVGLIYLALKNIRRKAKLSNQGQIPFDPNLI